MKELITAFSDATVNRLRNHETWNKESIQARSKLIADKMQTV